MKQKIQMLGLFALVALLIFGCTQTTPGTGTSTTPLNTTPPGPGTTTHSLPLTSSAVTYATSDGWNIHGTSYPAKNGAQETTKAVILAHMFSHDRSDYPETFIAYIHEQMPDAVILNIDLRGHGQSANLKSSTDFGREDFIGMKNDLISSKAYLKTQYPNVRSIYLVGASIGSQASINAAAQDPEFTKVVMLAPGRDYQEVNIDDSIRTYHGGLLLVASYEDNYSEQSIRELSPLVGASPLVTKTTYPIGHGVEIFGNEGQEEKLDIVIANFLKN
jgi:pimeloyl-ACP methyl ester carboxylesterase